MSEANANLLHDHYKETFAIIREKEKLRDRLFLWLVALLFVLVLEIVYPANIHAITGTATVGGVTIDIGAIPLALLLDISWIFYAGLALKYCQLTRAIERQYDYLHLLENRVSGILADEEVYRREGRAYLSDYPILLTWAGLCYAYLFPMAVTGVLLFLFGIEVRSLHYPWESKATDSVFFGVTLITIILYRFVGRRKRTENTSYLDAVASRIKDRLDSKTVESTSPQLLRLYAVLQLAKGRDVSRGRA